LNCWLEKQPVLDRSSQINSNPASPFRPINCATPNTRNPSHLQYVSLPDALHDSAALTDSSHDHFEDSRSASNRYIGTKRGKNSSDVLQGQTYLLDPPGGQYDDSTHPAQLTTPLDTCKRVKKQPFSRKGKGRSGNLPAFKNLTVSKPIQVHEKEGKSVQNDLPDAPPTVLSYQGWSSTESAVRNYVNTIGQTTLDKLAAFRYKTPSSSLHVRNRTSVNENPCHALDNDGDSHETRLLPLPEPDHVLDCDEFFQEANWSVDNHKQVRGTSAIPISMFEVEYFPEMGQLKAPKNGAGPDFSTSGIDSIMHTTHSHSGYIADPCMSTATPSSTHDPLLTPSSSTHERVLDSLLSVVEMTREDGETMHDASLRLEMPPAIIRHLEMMERDDDYYPHKDTVVLSETSVRTQDLAPSDPEEQGNVLAHPQIATERVKDVAGESDDEYDEGIDDTDLIKVSYDSERRVLSTDHEQRASAVPLSYVSNPASQMPPPPNSVGEYTDTTGVLLPSSPAILESDPDMDLLLMELAEEEEQKGISHMNGEAVETFEAPASIQHSLPCETSDNEIYDSTLQYSPPNRGLPTEKAARTMSGGYDADNHRIPEASPPTPVHVAPQASSEDWSFMKPLDSIHSQAHENPLKTRKHVPLCQIAFVDLTDEPRKSTQVNVETVVQHDIHGYTPLDRFSRPEFPNLVRDHSPIIGASTHSFLRVCFRIHEMYREGARCLDSARDGVIELFARVTFSSRNPGITKQHFQFADLWSKHPPFATGILENFRPQSLADVESQDLIGGDVGKIVRCLGRLRREKQNSGGWLLYIINIRQTDWEEIRWTKRIVSADASGPETAVSTAL
jgi:hypothetical protein